MNSGTLSVWMHGQLAGRLTRAEGRLSFSYDDAYRFDQDATPLSVAMPLATRRHDHSVVEPWLDGLVPDREATLTRWARQHDVAGHAFALLSTSIGMDCAGAVQFSREEEPSTAGSVTPVDDSDIAALLRDAMNASSAAGGSEPGWFSLGGAQAKTALSRLPDGRWGRPAGTAPTTHILKPAPASGDLPSFELNEALCLALLGQLGIPTTTAEVVTFDGIRTLVAQRYDRVVVGGKLWRVHQEDVCQATGTPPTVKYQSFGGPGTEATLNLLRERAETDITRFLDLQGVAWLIGATDIHAKNVSLQLARDAVRLAPAYDVASTLPYERRQGLKLAMHVGGEYRIDGIRRRHWERVADQAGVAPDSLLQRLAVLATAVPAAWDRAVDALALAAEDRMVANDFKAAIMPNVEACAAALTDPE